MVRPCSATTTCFSLTWQDLTEAQMATQMLGLNNMIQLHVALPGDQSTMLTNEMSQRMTLLLMCGMLWQEVSRLGPSMYFGELALLNNEPRKASVKVSSMVLLNGRGHEPFAGLVFAQLCEVSAGHRVQGATVQGCNAALNNQRWVW